MRFGLGICIIVTDEQCLATGRAAACSEGVDLLFKVLCTTLQDVRVIKLRFQPVR